MGRGQGAIAVAGRRADGHVHAELVEYRDGTEWIADRLVELLEKHNPPAVVLDPGGPAGGLIPVLTEAGIEPTLLTTRECAQACGSFYDLVVNEKVRHLNQKPVNVAVAGAKKRPMSDAWVWNRKESRADVSPLIAMTLAVHGHLVYGIPQQPMIPSVAFL